jgi:hypothetical protein
VRAELRLSVDSVSNHFIPAAISRDFRPIFAFSVCFLLGAGISGAAFLFNS